MRILLCTNGTPHAVRALRLGARIAQSAASAVDILVVSEKEAEEARRSVASVAADLETAGVPVVIHERTGQMAAEVVRKARTAPYSLLVIGSRGRRGMVRLLLGSVALRIAGNAPASVLVVKGRPRDLKRFLVCSSAGPTSERTIRFAGRLAQRLSASVTVVHVMSQLPLRQSAVPQDLQASAEELIERGSREGAHLSQVLDQLTAEGTATRVVVRHGLVLDEILAEAKEGRYDVLVIGAHVTPGLDGSLIEDMSADILLAANRPVLVVR